MYKIIYSILVLGLFSSCSVYMKLKYGTSKPKDEKLTKQVKYLVKHGIDTSYMFNLRDSSADVFWTTKYPLFTHDTIEERPFQVRTFDSLGNPSYNWSICYGFIENFFYNEEIGHEYMTNVVKTLDLRTIAKLSDDPEGFEKLIAERHDSYIVSFWAMYFGNPSVMTLKTLDTYVDTSKLDVVLIKCNLGRYID